MQLTKAKFEEQRDGERLKLPELIAVLYFSRQNYTELKKSV